MKISGQLTWQDYLQAQYLHMRPTRAARIVLFTLVGLILVILGAYMVIADFAAGVWMILPGLLPVVLVGGIFALYYLVLLPRRVQTLFGQHKELASPFEHEVTPTGLVSSNAFGYSNRPWGNFVRWQENDSLFLLYITDIQFVLIPKRFCAPGQADELRNALRENKVPEGANSYRGRFMAIALYFAILVIIGGVLYVTFFSRFP